MSGIRRRPQRLDIDFPTIPFAPNPRSELSEVPGLDILEIRIEALKALRSGTHFDHKKWYETVFRLPTKDDGDGTEVCYLQFMQLLESEKSDDYRSGFWIGCAVGTLSQLDDQKLNKCFEAFRQAQAEGDDGSALEEHLKKWLQALAPLLAIYKVDGEVWNSFVGFCKKMDFMKGVVVGDEATTVVVEEALRVNGWSLKPREKMESDLEKGYLRGREVTLKELEDATSASTG